VRRSPATALAAILLALLVPATGDARSGLGTGEDRGRAMAGMRGPAADLHLPDAVLRYAPPLAGLAVGVITPAAATPSGLPEPFLDGLTAARRQIDALGGTTRVCTTDGSTEAIDRCVAGFLRADLPAILVFGVTSDITDAAARAEETGAILVSVGDTPVPPSVVQVAIDRLDLGLEHGRTVGSQLAGLSAGGLAATGDVATAATGDQVLVVNADPVTAPAFAAVIAEGLREIDRRIGAPDRVDLDPARGAPAVGELVSARPNARALVGDGLDLAGLDPGALEALPTGVALYPWRCDAGLIALVDSGSAVRACGTWLPEVAGEAAANAIGQMLAGWDVPGFIEIPSFTYRGAVQVGPGVVLRGPQLPIDRIALSPGEQAAGAAALAGRTVGLITALPAGGREPADVRAMREALQASLAASGATLEVCATRGKADAARACVASFIGGEVAAIVTLRSRAEMREPVAGAIAAGIPVIGIDDARLGDAGAVYLAMDRAEAGRYQGDQAAGIAAGTWPGRPIEAIIIDAGGKRAQVGVWPAIPAVSSDAIERSLVRQAPTVRVVRRIAWSGEKAPLRVRRAVARRPDLRLVLGEAAPAAMGALGKRAAKDLVVLAFTCDAGMVTRIDRGGRLRACVGVDLVRAGEAAALVATKLLGGGSVPSTLTLPLTSHPSV
jgi:DNA-binding LacI/PurR family transcriptional regulator